MYNPPDIHPLFMVGLRGSEGMYSQEVPPWPFLMEPGLVSTHTYEKGVIIPHFTLGERTSV
jgi:hypothetical protein